jgi:hypothetical protein
VNEPMSRQISGWQASLVDGIRGAFALDLVFHLRDGGHDREQHGPTASSLEAPYARSLWL